MSKRGQHLRAVKPGETTSPSAKAAFPTAPAGLSKKAKRVWGAVRRRVEADGIRFSNVDVGVLLAYVTGEALLLVAQEVLDRELTYTPETEGGLTRLDPLVKLIFEASNLVRLNAKELGFTARARRDNVVVVRDERDVAVDRARQIARSL